MSQIEEDFVPPVPGDMWTGYFGRLPALAVRRMVSPRTGSMGTVFNVAPPILPPEEIWFSDFVCAHNGWHKA